MTPTDFSLEPYVGPLPLRFGMSPTNARQIMGANPFERDCFGGGFLQNYKGVLVYFDEASRMREVTFNPSAGVRLLFRGKALMERGLMAMSFFDISRLDPSPKEDAGAVFLFSLGISYPATSAEQLEDPSLTMFRADLFQDLR